MAGPRPGHSRIRGPGHGRNRAISAARRAQTPPQVTGGSPDANRVTRRSTCPCQDSEPRWRNPLPASSASPAARSRRNGPAAAKPAANGTPSRKKPSSPAPARPPKPRLARAVAFVGLAGSSRTAASRSHWHRRTRPRAWRRPGARLRGPGRRRPRHRQIHPAAPGRRPPGRLRHARSLRLRRGIHRPGPPARPPPGRRRRRHRTCRRDQRPRHRRQP